MKTVPLSDENLPLSWFIRLRRLAFAGQGIILLWAVSLLKIQLPIAALVASLCLIPIGEVLFRFFSQNRSGSLPSALVGSLLIWDTLTLTGLLYLSGGPTNPFSIVYLVQVVLSAVLLGSWWTWGIAALSTTCFALLFLWHLPVHVFHHHEHGAGLSVHLKGMLLSYALVSALVAYFLGKVVSERRQAEKRAEMLFGAHQRFAALTSVMADAAHRLGTPLASLGLVTHELARLISSKELVHSKELEDDVSLLSKEVARCKGIIEELCTSAGAIQGNGPEVVKLSDVVEAAFGNNEALRSHVRWRAEGVGATVTLHLTPVSMALRSLLQNAVDATHLANSNAKVELEISQSESWITFRITDEGLGMNSEQLNRVKEPFYSTKEGGMGLGVYTAELVAQQLGGILHFTSEEDMGTAVTFSVPSQNDRAKGKREEIAA